MKAYTLLFCDLLVHLKAQWLSVHPRRYAIISATPSTIRRD